MDERYDLVRAVRDKQFRYIRNYMPFRMTLQHIDYLFNAPSALSWENAFRSGRTNEVQGRYFKTKPVEELYNTENDPWEINNLANNPAYKKVLLRMREAEKDWRLEIRDVGMIPETEYEDLMGEKSMYDYMRSSECPLGELLRASELAALGTKEDLNTFVDLLHDKNNSIRYWGATGLLILKDGARPAISELKVASNDRSGAVATLAAEALYGLGETESAIKAYTRILLDTVTYKMSDRNFALNSIEAIDAKNPEIITIIRKLYFDNASGPGDFAARYSNYDVTMSEYLLKKWYIIER